MSAKVKNADLHFLPVHTASVLATASRLANRLMNERGQSKDQALIELQKVALAPDNHLEGDFAELSRLLVTELNKLEYRPHSLHEAPLPYEIYGEDGIDKGALEQMETSLRLPISVAGALMPDAHVGYGLPIGGVLATQPDKVIPYAVGVDIACRMCLTLYDLPTDRLEKEPQRFERYLLDNTVFGIGGTHQKPMDDDFFDDPEWNAVPFIKSLKDKAWHQAGTSGTGNHFVEWGIVVVSETCAEFPLPKGEYIALLSHSGSRGFGASIANQYSQLAMQTTKLPREAQHLAWLDLNTQAGQEYWIGMNMAGQYASLNHHQIHKRIAKAIGLEPLTMVENHHNFAWKETLPDGREVLVHRKGATPASLGEIGVIPGSSVQPGFVVRGKGAVGSLQSASHGAGRQMSRSQAFKALTGHQVKEELKRCGVRMIGGDIDEAPAVYKNIRAVMAMQSDLVDVLATFYPKIIRMADPDRRKGARED